MSLIIDKSETQTKTQLAAEDLRTSSETVGVWNLFVELRHTSVIAKPG